MVEIKFRKFAETFWFDWLSGARHFVAKHLKLGNLFWGYKITCWLDRAFRELFPCHPELRKAVPKEWADLDGVIENFLFAAIISFVEKENGLSQIQTIEEGNGWLKKLEEGNAEETKTAQVYFVKHWGSAELFKSYVAANLDDYRKLREIYQWAKYVRFDFNEEECGEYLKKRNTFYLTALIKLRDRLWT